MRARSRLLAAVSVILGALAVPTSTPVARAQASASPYLSFRVWATGYAPNTEGSVEVALPDRCVKFAALGQTTNLANAGCGVGYRTDMDWRVRVTPDGGQPGIFPVREVGPWNIDDDYWDPAPGSGHPRTRRLFTDLPRGMPQAQAAFDTGYNTAAGCKDLQNNPTTVTGPADQFGRCVLNRAGIDLSLAAAAQLGMTGSGWVTVEFLWEPARGGYLLDGWGGIHPFNGAPRVTSSAYWPGWDIARGLAARPGGPGGYVLDGWGGLHPFGGAPAVTATSYFPGFDIARGLALDPGDAAGTRGYVVDGWGGLHPFGGAPAVRATAYFPGRDIVKGVVVNPRTAQYPYVTGYVLTAFGEIAPFAEAGQVPPPSPAGTRWGFDIARGLALSGFGQGYVVTGFGSVHPFGGAVAAFGGPWWPGYDIARGLIYDPEVAGGYVLDGRGGVHAFNGAPRAQSTVYFSWDIANAVSGAGSPQ